VARETTAFHYAGGLEWFNSSDAISIYVQLWGGGATGGPTLTPGSVFGGGGAYISGWLSILTSISLYGYWWVELVECVQTVILRVCEPMELTWDRGPVFVLHCTLEVYSMELEPLPCSPWELPNQP